MGDIAKRILLPLGVFVAFALTFASWAVSSPVGSSPDDPFHLASIWCATDLPGEQCAPADGKVDPGTLSRQLPGDVVGAPCYAMDSGRSAECVRDLDTDLVPNPVNDGLYPRGFYRVMHWFVTDDVAQSVVVMRLVNSVAAAALIAAALLLAPAGLRRASALSWLVGLVPLGVFFIPSTNPTSWVIVGIGTYWVFLMRFLRGDRGWGTIAAGALAVAAALITISARVDGAAYLCVTTAASVLLSMSRLRDLVDPRNLLPAVIGVGAFARFVTFQSSSVLVSGASPLDASEPGRDGLALLLNNLFAFPTYLAGMFGQTFGLGWLDTYMPPAVGWTTGAMAVVLVMLSVGTYWFWKRLAVLLLGLTVVVVPLLVLQQSHAFVGEVVQPRYVYPAVLAFFGVVAYTSERGDLPSWVLRKAHVVALVVGASIANTVALHTEIKRYVTGLDVRRLDLSAQAEWWWSTGPGPMTLWVLGSIAGTTLFAVLGAVVLRAASPPEESVREPEGTREAVAA